jgi:signal transduction histidine kinase
MVHSDSSRATRQLWIAQAAVVVGGLGVTVVTVLVPALRLTLDAPTLRVGLEVTGLCLVLFAAATLALPAAADVRPARDAFVTALVIIGFANALFAVLPVVSDGRLAVDRGLAFIPWIASRYLAGLAFLAAVVERPRLGLARTLATGIALLVVVEGVLIGLGDRLGVPVRIGVGEGRSVEVVDPFQHALIELGPAVLFLVGAWLSGRLSVRSRFPAYLWLSVALLLQVFTHIHEILYPAILGPIITTADVFRSLAWVALAVGAFAQLRYLYRSRSRTVREQAEDLTRQDELVDRLSRLAQEEQDLRTLITHELATPIAAIRAYAHVVRVDPGSDRAKEAATAIEAEARSLSELIARMDDFKDLESDSFACQLRPVRAQPLVADAVRFARGLPGAHPITAACSDIRVMADPVRLGQLLRNLLANAAQYSPPGSPVVVHGRVLGGRFELVVTDDGRGIAAEERELVLQRYHRGESSSEVEGSGIGLYVAARIAEAHGGTLRIEDGPDGHGLAVVVDLELAA